MTQSLSGTYLFNDEILNDLNKNKNIEISGERYVQFRRIGSAVVAWITEDIRGPEFEVDADFDLSQYQADLLSMPMAPPKFEYVVWGRDLISSGAEKIR